MAAAHCDSLLAPGTFFAVRRLVAIDGFYNFALEERFVSGFFLYASWL